MKDYIKKFDNASDANNYFITDIPFTTSVATNPIQNLVCNQSDKKLVSVGGIIEIQSAGPEMVDLGLPSGILWAAINVGAVPGSTKESYYGNYYAWGETETKSNYAWSTYEHGTDWNKLTKYCPSDKDNFWDGEGFPDNKLVLDAVDDIVTSTYGPNYVMPTVVEIEELINGTDREWVTNYNGITDLNGYKFMKKSDHSVFIFIPAAGFFDGTSVSVASFSGYIWSSSLVSDGPNGAQRFYFNNGGVYTNFGDRYLGYSARAIKRV